nr:MAG TPA: hypothetical protein [Bacteriophage sp.]
MFRLIVLWSHQLSHRHNKLNFIIYENWFKFLHYYYYQF